MDDVANKIIVDGSGWLLNGGFLLLVVMGSSKIAKFLAPLVRSLFEKIIEFIESVKAGVTEQAASIKALEKAQETSFKTITESADRNNQKVLEILGTMATAIKQMAVSDQQHSNTLAAVATNQEALLKVMEKKP